MCTAICDGALFGRTLDLERSFGESVVITPRNFPISFLHEPQKRTHYAIIGVAHLSCGAPLYYDAMNEKGLCIAALNFPSYAHYSNSSDASAVGYKIASFEVIPWVLSSSESVKDAAELLGNTTITSDNFSPELRATPLHFMISDRERSITVEQTERGLCIYENNFGVMTNSPPFDYHIANLSNFTALSSQPPENKLCPSASLENYSRGMGAVGLPGDFSSPSRFVRAIFCKSHATQKKDKGEQINRFFHIFDTVSVPEGCVKTKTEKGEDVLTVYTSCADMESLTYHFTTYDERKIRAVSLADGALDGEKPMIFSMSAR